MEKPPGSFKFLPGPKTKICESDIKGERGPVITPKAAGNSDSSTDIIKTKSSSTVQTSVNPCLRLPQRPLHYPAPGPNVIQNNRSGVPHVIPCNINIILNTIALNGLDKVSLENVIYFLLIMKHIFSFRTVPLPFPPGVATQ